MLTLQHSSQVLTLMLSISTIGRIPYRTVSSVFTENVKVSIIVYTENLGNRS